MTFVRITAPDVCRAFVEQAGRLEKREAEERQAKENATRRLESVAREARERQLKVGLRKEKKRKAHACQKRLHA
eukprot:1159635-Pelagomonas_calceolata.AAC.10